VKTLPADNQNRLVYLDVLNVFACFCVIVLHSTTKYFHPDGSKPWYFSLMLQSFCICAVPLFFMLSGAKLLEYRQKYSTKTFLIKRLLRILIPFIIWSIIYLIWKLETSPVVIKGPIDLANMFLKNQILQIFWFFYALIPMYLCIPFLSLMAQPKYKRLMLLFCAFGFFNMGIIPVVIRFTHLDFGPLTIPIAGSCLAYLVMGWLIKNENMDIKWRRVIYAAGVVSCALIFILTAVLTKGRDQTDRVFVTTNSIFTIILAVSIFLFFKHMNLNKLASGKPNKILRLLSSASFGVYLVQMLIISIIHKIPFINEFSPLYSIFGSITVYIVCVAIVTLVRKIPVIRWIFP
jgi:surface polysaccharide O-acyltransferase-like enzyme